MFIRRQTDPCALARSCRNESTSGNGLDEFKVVNHGTVADCVEPLQSAAQDGYFLGGASVDENESAPLACTVEELEPHRANHRVA